MILRFLFIFIYLWGHSLYVRVRRQLARVSSENLLPPNGFQGLKFRSSDLAEHSSWPRFYFSVTCAFCLCVVCVYEARRGCWFLWSRTYRWLIPGTQLWSFEKAGRTPNYGVITPALPTSVFTQVPKFFRVTKRHQNLVPDRSSTSVLISLFCF